MDFIANVIKNHAWFIVYSEITTEIVMVLLAPWIYSGYFGLCDV